MDTIAQNGELVGDAERTFRMVTITFLVDGGDDYPYANFPNTDRVDLTEAMTEEQSGGQATFTDPGTEQDALAEYLAAHFSETPFDIADVGPESDERIQNLAFRADSLMMPVPSKNVYDIALSAGLNMISLPLMPEEPYTARSFMEKPGRRLLLRKPSHNMGVPDSVQVHRDRDIPPCPLFVLSFGVFHQPCLARFGFLCPFTFLLQLRCYLKG